MDIDQRDMRKCLDSTGKVADIYKTKDDWETLANFILRGDK